MASKSCTFIIVPDATAQCKRYTVSKSLFYLFGIIGGICVVVCSIVLFIVGTEYRTMAMKVDQLSKLRKISLSQKNTIERYENDILQLGNNLSAIKEQNSKLMVLTGLDPSQGAKELGLGGGVEEKIDAISEEQIPTKEPTKSEPAKKVSKKTTKKPSKKR